MELLALGFPGTAPAVACICGVKQEMKDFYHLLSTIFYLNLFALPLFFKYIDMKF